MTVLLILITYQDWKERKIRNQYIILIFLIGIMKGGYIQQWGWTKQVLGLVSVSIPMFLLNQIFPNSFGMGDLKLAGAAGIYLGARKMWSAFCISIFLAGAYIIFAQGLKKHKSKDIIAFGPFLSIGIFLCML